MDNIIWLIVASAVTIALAGILLYLGGDVLEQAENESDNIIEEDEEQWLNPSSYSEPPDSGKDRAPLIETVNVKREASI